MLLVQLLIENLQPTFSLSLTKLLVSSAVYLGLLSLSVADQIQTLS